MSLIALGPDRIQVSRVVLGCMWSSSLSEVAIHRLIHAAIDHGITSFDTAPLYGFHTSEEILGRALRDRRSQVQILTKAGLRWDAEHGRVLFEFTDDSGQWRAVRKDSRPDSLRFEIEASLRRLGVDQIDLVQIHHPDVDTAIADSLGVLARMRDAGKIRAIGVSNYAPDQLRQAIDVLGQGGLDALQCHFSLAERWPERELLPICIAHQVGVLAYSPLSRGWLAGRRARRGRVQQLESLHDRVLAMLVEHTADYVLAPVAERYRVSVSQVALAWLLAQTGLTAVICGASTIDQIEHNAAASEVRLSADDQASIGSAFARVRPVQRLIDRGFGAIGGRPERWLRRLLG